MDTKHCSWYDLVDDWKLINVEELSNDDAEVIEAIEDTAYGQYVHNTGRNQVATVYSSVYLSTWLHTYMDV